MDPLVGKLPKELEKLLDGGKAEKYPTSFHLPKGLVATFRARCAKDEKKPSQVIEALIRWYLAADK